MVFIWWVLNMPRPPKDPYTRHCGKYYRFSYTRGNQTRYLCTRYLNDGVWTAKLSTERCRGTLIVITRGDDEEDMVYLEEDHVCTNENEGKASGPTNVIVHEPDNRPPLTITNRIDWSENQITVPEVGGCKRLGTINRQHKQRSLVFSHTFTQQTTLRWDTHSDGMVCVSDSKSIPWFDNCEVWSNKICTKCSIAIRWTLAKIAQWLSYNSQWPNA